MQVYKELDIGTAKIHRSEMQGFPHHFFDVKEPTETFSVAEYQLAVRAMDRGYSVSWKTTYYCWRQWNVYSVRFV